MALRMANERLRHEHEARKWQTAKAERDALLGIGCVEAVNLFGGENSVLLADEVLARIMGAEIDPE